MQVSQLAKEIAERILRQKDDELACRGAAELVQSAMDAVRAGSQSVALLCDASWTIGDSLSDVHLKFDGQLVDGEVTHEKVMNAVRRSLAMDIEPECERLRALLGSMI